MECISKIIEQISSLLGFNRAIKPSPCDKDPIDFKGGLLADTGISYMQFLKKLFIPDYARIETVKKGNFRTKKWDDCPGSFAPAPKRRERKERCRPARPEPFCPKKAPKPPTPPRSKIPELSDIPCETTVDRPSKCGEKKSTTTVYCDKCCKCTRIVDCTNHQK